MRIPSKRSSAVLVCAMLMCTFMPACKTRTANIDTTPTAIMTTSIPSPKPTPKVLPFPEGLTAYWDQSLGAVVKWTPFLSSFACTLERKDAANTDFIELTTVSCTSGKYIDFTCSGKGVIPPVYRLCMHIGDNQVYSALAKLSLPITFGNTGGNLLCGGFACFHNGVSYRMANQRGIVGIYACTDTDDATLLSQGIATHLNASESYLYYLSYPEGQLFRVPLDGSAASVKLTEERMSSLLVAGDRVYGTRLNDAVLMVMSMDGGDPEVFISAACYDLGGYGNAMYYTCARDASFCMMDLTTEKITAFPLSNRSYAQVWQDKVYFINQNDGSNLYRCNLDGSGKERLHDQAVISLNVSDHGIYLVLAEDKCPYRANSDGSGIQKLADIQVESLCVAGSDVIMVNNRGKLYCMGEDGVLR